MPWPELPGDSDAPSPESPTRGPKHVLCLISGPTPRRPVRITSACRAAPLQTSSVLQVSAVATCLHLHGCCHSAMREAAWGTARCSEVFAAQQRLVVRRNQYILQWRETEPSSGPAPSQHKGIWNVDQEQSSLLITACFVPWKMCDIGFTSWIPNCLAIFPSTSHIYWSVGAWLSLQHSSDWHHSVVETHLPHYCSERAESALAFAIAGQVQHPQDSWFPQNPHLPASLIYMLGPSFLSHFFQKTASSITNRFKHSEDTTGTLGIRMWGSHCSQHLPDSQRHKGRPFPSPLEAREIPSSSLHPDCHATPAKQRGQPVSQRGKEKSKGRNDSASKQSPGEAPLCSPHGSLAPIPFSCCSH